MGRCSGALLAALPVAVWLSQGQPPPADRPGLRVEFAQQELRDQRSSRLLALHVPAGTMPTPFLAAGAFTAEFHGELEIDARDRFTFTFVGTGRLTVEIGGKEVLRADSALPGRISGDVVRLNRGRQPIRARYEAPPGGEAQLRVLWQSAAFGPEPLPPSRLWHAATPELTAALQLRRGRDLALQHACARCHATAAGPRTLAREEAARSGPDLARAGARFTSHWLVQWVLDPHRFRPDTAMPRLVRGEDAEQSARDLVAWLEQGALADAATGAGDASHGARLVDDLRCIGCHTLPGQDADPQRIPLGHVAEKWRPGRLADYLRTPDRDHAWAGMPDFALSADEAAAIAAFLQPRPPPTAPSGGDAARGARLFAELGCAHCHSVGDQPATTASLPSDDPQRGCLAASGEARGAAPDFAFAPDELAALRAVHAHPGALAADCVVEDSARLLARLRCSACHAIDADKDRWSQVREVTAERIELPALTWAGEKLTTSYLQKLLPGAELPRARPWLAERMPGFAGPVGARLAGGLAAAHGLGREFFRTPAPDARLAAAGARLAGKDGGFDCRQCHAIGGLAPSGVFDVQGIDFTSIASRLRREYFLRWMRDPLRIDPGTKMPRYADANGRTGLVDHFGGDAGQQFLAIWQHLLSLAR